MVGLVSAAGLIGLLDEPNDEIKCYALKQLDASVHQFWAELADHVSKMWVTVCSRDVGIAVSGWSCLLLKYKLISTIAV